MTVGSLFAGIGGFDLGFERAGFEIKWQVEMPCKSALCKRAEKFRGHSCEACGATTKLQAHHIDGNRLNNSRENIQTLCATCHLTHHHRARRAGLMVAGRLVCVA